MISVCIYVYVYVSDNSFWNKKQSAFFSNLIIFLERTLNLEPKKWDLNQLNIILSSKFVFILLTSRISLILVSNRDDGISEIVFLWNNVY